MMLDNYYSLAQQPTLKQKNIDMPIVYMITKDQDEPQASFTWIMLSPGQQFVADKGILLHFSI